MGEKRKRRRREKRKGSKGSKGKKQPNPKPTPEVAPTSPVLQTAVNEVRATEHDNETHGGDVQKNQTSVPAKNPSVVRRMIFWEVVFACLVATFTGLQVCVTWCQWTAMREQLDVMRQDQRPWLMIDVPTFSQPVVGEPLEMVFPIRNTGQSPAFVEEATFTVTMGPTESVEALALLALKKHDSTHSKVKSTVPPDTVYKWSLRDGPVIKDDTEPRLFEGALTIFVVTRIVYTDSNGRRHASRRMFISDPKLAAMSGYGGEYEGMD